MKKSKPQTKVIDVRTGLQVDYANLDTKLKTKEARENMSAAWVKKIMTKPDADVIRTLRSLLSCKRVSENAMNAYHTRLDVIIEKLENEQKV